MDPFDAIMQHYQAGRLDQARVMLMQVLASRPRDAQVHGFLSIVLLQMGDVAAANLHALQATKCDPRSSDAWVWLGNTQAAMSKHEEALLQFDRALVFRSDNAAAWVGKLLSLRFLGRVQQAVKSGEKAIKKCSGDERVVATYAATLLAAGRALEAFELAKQGLKSWPASLELASVLAGSSNYPSELSLGEVFESQLKYGQILDRSRANVTAVYGNSREPYKRLRIGFVSSDLREHSVSYFMQPILEHADRAKCELYCYSTTAYPDAHTDVLRKCTDHWRDAARLDELALHERIRADAIDVLIDLHGHTVGHRLGLFHRRPAPVQATYCGYPNITGIRGIDYRIVDSITDPVSALPGQGEKLVRMRGCFLCYAPPVRRRVETIADRPVTFGSFNAVQKISTGTLSLWKSVLDAVPGSRLAMKAMVLREAELKEVFLGRIAAAGIAVDRVDILDPSPDVQSHLEQYNQIDIALDTVPYNGTTTTCEALAMGVPVITLRGDRHASRVSASLLTAAGFPQWIAESPAQVAEIAGLLGADPAERRRLRVRIPEQLTASSLCNGKDFADRFLESVREMWMHWAQTANT